MAADPGAGSIGRLDREARACLTTFELAAAGFPGAALVGAAIRFEGTVAHIDASFCRATPADLGALADALLKHAEEQLDPAGDLATRFRAARRVLGIVRGPYRMEGAGHG